jgi:mRNA interferase RelE/StbE
MKALAGYVRHAVKRAVDALAANPRPSSSTSLDIPEFEGDLRRLRIESWRIICAVSDADRTVDVLGVRKRPPYQYEDLQDSFARLLQ